MPVRIISLLMFLMAGLLIGISPSRAATPSMSAKQFPTGYFYPYRQISMAAKAQVLGKLDATLKKLNQEGYGLIAKGAVLEKIGPELKTYDKLTILDESGLIIIAHRVPNLYYQYPGPAGLNPNTFLVVKGARVNFPESYIRYGFVVEGNYVAYANKFVQAILESLDRGVHGSRRPPAPPPR